MRLFVSDTEKEQMIAEKVIVAREYYSRLRRLSCNCWLIKNHDSKTSYV